jgi:hypothetical protein
LILNDLFAPEERERFFFLENAASFVSVASRGLNERNGLENKTPARRWRYRDRAQCYPETTIHADEDFVKQSEGKKR